MVRRTSPNQETPTPLQFALVVETTFSAPDTPDLHLRIDEDQLRLLVDSVSPYLGPLRQEYRQILAALERIERQFLEN